jgi:hypothetical protein
MRGAGEASQGHVHHDVGKEWQHHAGKQIHAFLCMHAGYVLDVWRMGMEASQMQEGRFACRHVEGPDVSPRAGVFSSHSGLYA